MPKLRTIRKWSHGRLRRVITKRTKNVLSDLLSDLRSDPTFPKHNQLSAGSAAETKLLNSMSKRIAFDLAGVGQKEYQSIVNNGTAREISTEEVIQIALKKERSATND